MTAVSSSSPACRTASSRFRHPVTQMGAPIITCTPTAAPPNKISPMQPTTSINATAHLTSKHPTWTTTRNIRYTSCSAKRPIICSSDLLQTAHAPLPQSRQSFHCAGPLFATSTICSYFFFFFWRKKKIKKIIFPAHCSWPVIDLTDQAKQIWLVRAGESGGSQGCTKFCQLLPSGLFRDNIKCARALQMIKLDSKSGAIIYTVIAFWCFNL